MKICDKCGAQQSDKRNNCIDCGNALGNPLSESELREVESEIRDKIDRSYNASDPLYVSRADKIIGILSLTGIITAIIFMFIYRQNVPELFLTIILFTFCAVNSLIPKINWTLEKIRLYFLIHDADDLHPSYFYFIMRKITLWVSFFIAITFLMISILNLF